jgi:hypothetical protein
MTRGSGSARPATPSTPATTAPTHKDPDSPEPKLKADVFENLNDDQQDRTHATRADAQVADVLAYTLADDAFMDLDHERRRPVRGAVRRIGCSASDAVARPDVMTSDPADHKASGRPC